MTKTTFISHESYFHHNSGEGALFEPPSEFIENMGYLAESPQSKRRVKNLIEKSGLMAQLVQTEPQPATEAQLAYFHTEAHIENVKKLSDGEGGFCGDSAFVGKGSYEIAKLSAGGAITAVQTVVTDANIRNAYVLTRPPGHHAMANEGMGFCIFNNAVISAKYAQNELGIKKILILDWDAHHGNGTEDAFYDDDSVLYISLHQEGLEPIGRGNVEDRGVGKGAGYTINIPLPAGSGDAVYEYAFRQIVVPAVQDFAPELIIVSAGQDGNIFDPLARMMLSAEGFRTMTKFVKELANEYANGRLVCLHEGGYCPVYVPFCTLAIIEELSGITTDAKDPFIYALAGTTYNRLLEWQKARVDEVRDAIFR